MPRSPETASVPAHLTGAAQGALLSWSERTRRDLPWRQTRDPWAVLVAELMLQQTQVARVVPRYPAFLAEFPDAERCATAGLASVVRAWAGLGYNRRAVNLHRCASVVVDVHGGRLPDDLAALLALPGIGPYTARAVLAFAFERDHGVVDTNAARVLARLRGHRLQRLEVQALADQMVPPGKGWAWNQAILDLGATVCTKRKPSCAECPLSSWCAWASICRSGPDPAVGSAGVGGKQSRFEGSDRQGRGRLVDALRRGPVAEVDLAATMGWPGDGERSARVAATLVADGLARKGPGDSYALPDGPAPSVSRP